MCSTADISLWFFYYIREIFTGSEILSNDGINHMMRNS